MTVWEQNGSKKILISRTFLLGREKKVLSLFAMKVIIILGN